MGNRRNAINGLTWFEKFAQGDQAVQQFCNSNGTTVNKFFNWRRRMRKAEADPEVDVLFVSVGILAAQMKFELPGDAIAQ